MQIQWIGSREIIYLMKVTKQAFAAVEGWLRTMGKTLEEKLQDLSPERCRRVDEQAVALIAEELSLRDLRKALNMTQEQLAESLQIKQEGVSRLEQRTDLLW